MEMLAIHEVWIMQLSTSPMVSELDHLNDIDPYFYPQLLSLKSNLSVIFKYLLNGNNSGLIVSKVYLSFRPQIINSLPHF